jgi:CBS domain-containing protein/ribosome-associated translation inhibitor RaiA
MELREVMSTRVVTIGPDEAAIVARRLMQKEHIRHLVVTEDGVVVGVLSARDLEGGAALELHDAAVEQLMSELVESAPPDMSIDEAAERMREARVGCLPVVDEDGLVGIVTATDVFDELGHGEARQRSRPRAQAARARPRRHESGERRAPFAGRKPRAVKRIAGRTSGPEVPAHIRVSGTELDEGDRGYIRRKLGMKLGKFAESIERVSVRIADVNGPRGGVDQRCRIKVVLSGLPSVLGEQNDPSRDAAIDGAIATVERAVRRALERRRMKPMTRRSYGESASAVLRS